MLKKSENYECVHIGCTHRSDLCCMELFEQFFRNLTTRGITFSKEEMMKYGIRRIYNSFGLHEYCNENTAKEQYDNFIKRGEICLLETAKERKVFKSSVIVFEDVVSRNLFAIRYQEYFFKHPDFKIFVN